MFIRNRRGMVLLAVYAMLLLVTAALIWKFGSPEEPQAQKVGFITTGGTDAGGEGSSNYQGIRAACRALGVELLSRGGVPESAGICPQAVQELVNEGAEMIILSSSGYSEEMEPYFADYPEVSFYGISPDISAPNLTSYSTRVYQIRYLSGIIAGMQTRTNEIGFVAPGKSCEVYRSVNAFALGVRRVNPKAEVVVAWSDAQAPPGIDAIRDFIRDEDIDVITHHGELHEVVDAAEAEGIATIGFNEPADNVSSRYLTCATCNWLILYEELIREYLRGQSSHTVNDWLGLESGVVSLTSYSPLVSAKAIAEVDLAKQEILSGLDVFTGKIYDNQGNLRCGEGESMSDETLLRHIDWLAEGVRSYE